MNTIVRCLLGLGALSWTAAIAGCGGASDASPNTSPQEGSELPSQDLPAGDLQGDDAKADGEWGAATTCKPIPNLPRLASPEIFISLHGLTLRLKDNASDYEKVFPIGPGAIDTDPSSPTYNESLSTYPLDGADRADFEIRPEVSTGCKIWHGEGAEKMPLFAGLPFMSWSGNYGIHGPIDNYRAPNGGSLRRGFVSAGCVRMQAADVLELYARIRGVAHVPVHVQKAPERDAQGRRVDLSDKWLGSECQTDADCNFAGGQCRTNPYSTRGFCTQACTAYCPDKPGAPTSFCVADGAASNKGMCVLQEVAQNPDCRVLDHFQPKLVERFSQSAVKASACLPGSPGWIGDHCRTNADCQAPNQCKGATDSRPGICTQSCTAACPDQPGWPVDTCINEPSLGGANCLRMCTPSTNGDECPAGYRCETRPNFKTSASKNVCVPVP